MRLDDLTRLFQISALIRFVGPVQATGSADTVDLKSGAVIVLGNLRQIPTTGEKDADPLDLPIIVSGLTKIVI